MGPDRCWGAYSFALVPNRARLGQVATESLLNKHSRSAMIRDGSKVFEERAGQSAAMRKNEGRSRNLLGDPAIQGLRTILGGIR